MNDQGLESSPYEVRKLGRAPAALRIAGGAALAWGAFLGIGVIAGQVVTQAMFGDADTVPTLPDWTAIVALVVVGRGLLRSRWWAGVGAWVTSLGLIVFGVWALGDSPFWGWGTGPTDPIPNHVTGAQFTWLAFFVPGLIMLATLLPRSSRAWIRQATRARKASNH